ncbi:MAG TPA: HD domain-containing phosphohydrolase [Thermoanaerobaculia bacterium]
MLSELKAIEARLKQVLYGCVEHVQATKAALYLPSSHDLSQKSWEVVTSYQYNVSDRAVVKASDDLVDRMVVKRDAFYVNGLTADQRFAEMMFRQGNDRMLIAPLMSRGRLIGFIDMRDKAGRKSFEDADIKAAREISSQMLAVLSEHKLFGLEPLALVEDPAPAITGSQETVPRFASQREQPAGGASAPYTPSREALGAIDSARQYLSRRQLAPQTGKRTAGERELDAMRILLPSALAMPGALIAVLSMDGSLDNPRMVAARAELSDDAMTLILTHVGTILRGANQPHMTSRPAVLKPFGSEWTDIAATRITAIASLPVNPQSLDGLQLTVAFEQVSKDDASRVLQGFLRQLEPSIDAALASAGGSVDRPALAEHLLEPDFRRYPDLAKHSREVSATAARFARHLALPASQVETIRLAALVHDVGFRLLDYEDLYHQPRLLPEQRRLMAQHTIVGAALVEPLLGPEVAQAVLRHHERFDGQGYPSRLSGQQIPLAARIIQIADAWIAMTTQQPYQSALGKGEAVSRLRETAGTQFDPKLVELFLGALQEITA